MIWYERTCHQQSETGNSSNIKACLFKSHFVDCSVKSKKIERKKQTLEWYHVESFLWTCSKLGSKVYWRRQRWTKWAFFGPVWRCQRACPRSSRRRPELDDVDHPRCSSWIEPAALWRSLTLAKAAFSEACWRQPFFARTSKKQFVSSTAASPGPLMVGLHPVMC